MKIILLLLLSCLTLSLPAQNRGLRDTLKGLVFEAEDWSEPKDAWLPDQSTPNKWNLWSKEEDVWNKRSNGKSLQSPFIKEDRATPEEGAPPLHTKITGIPNGLYEAFLGNTSRPLGYSLDGGKNWLKSTLGETSLGFYDIQDGTFEVWVDDKFANTGGNLGWAYYDYVRLLPTTIPDIKNLQAFTLPSGQTQISWITTATMSKATVLFGQDGKLDNAIQEEESGHKNHRVTLPNLTQGQKYTASISYTSNKGRPLASNSVSFVAGAKPIPPKTKEATIELQVLEPTEFGRDAWPVTSGIPFAKGTLANENHLRLFDQKNAEIPIQTSVFSTWEDGSIKWITLDFIASTKPGKATIYTLKASPISSARLATPPAKELKPNHPEIVLGDGTTLTPKLNAITYNLQGPIRSEATVNTDYLDKDGKLIFTATQRLTTFPALKAQLTQHRIAITNHDLKKPNTLVKSITCVLDNANQITLTDGTKTNGFAQFLESQASITQGNATKSLEAKLDGTFETNDNKTFQIKDFWQTYPKAVSINGNQLMFHLLPKLPTQNYPPENWRTADPFFMHFYWFHEKGNYKFKRGMRVENEAWSLAEANATQAQKAAWLQAPLFATASPDYYCETQVFGNIEPKIPGRFDDYEETFLISYENLEKGRKVRGEYGWMNYGDWFGERQWNWGNNEYDLTFALILQFVRTRNLEYLQRALQMAHHYTTIDTQHIRAPKHREIVYAHSTGHVGSFIENDDPLFVSLGKTQASARGGQDGSGGHAHHPGSILAAALTGNPCYATVAIDACTTQATRYTPNYKIYIERAVGWSIVNAVAAYQHTHNPFYLNAARIFFQAVAEQQNPKTGCFDLYQDQSECDCPDKKEHRGGKAFATGVLLHGLIRLYETTGDEDVATSIVRCADWLLDESWNPERRGFRYKTGCPKYANSGGFTPLIVEGLLYATKLTGNKRYLNHILDHFGRYLKSKNGSGRAAGKSFTQIYRQGPYHLALIHQLANVQKLETYVPPLIYDKSGCFVDKDGKGSFKLKILGQDENSYTGNITVVKANQLKIIPSEENISIKGKGLVNSNTFTIVLEPNAENPFVDIKVDFGKTSKTIHLEPAMIPSQPTLGNKIAFVGGSKNFTAIAFEQLGYPVEHMALPNNKLDGYKAIVFGADSLGVSADKLDFKSAAKLLAFANAGGKVVFMQLNDSFWDVDLLGEPLVMVEPDSKASKILQPNHPLFNKITSLDNAICYDSIDEISSKWNVLATDNKTKPCIATLKQGKGEIIVIIPSFDRFHIPGNIDNINTGKQFLENLWNYIN